MKECKYCGDQIEDDMEHCQNCNSLNELIVNCGKLTDLCDQMIDENMSKLERLGKIKVDLTRKVKELQ